MEAEQIIKTARTEKEMNQDIYLKTGAHIGTKFKSGDMRKYIYKQRKDGLKVLDVQVIEERVKLAAKLLSYYDPKKIVVVSRRLYGYVPAEEFAKTIGARALLSRFIPGTFTNHEGKEFIEPEVVVVTEPESDWQAIKEATDVRVPVIGLASTNNSLKHIDLVVPINNKGRKSLALIYWILAREVLKARGDIKTDEEYSKKLEDFEFKMKDGVPTEEFVENSMNTDRD